MGMSTMLQDKGEHYTTEWPKIVAAHHGLGLGYIAQAIEKVTGKDITEHDLHMGTQPNEIVSDLSPAQAKQVFSEVRQIKAALRANRGCWCCGLDLVDGECPACGEL